MARKNVIEETEYHGRGGKSTIIQYNLIIPVTLNRSVKAPRFPYQERFKNESYVNLAVVFWTVLFQEFSIVSEVTFLK